MKKAFKVFLLAFLAAFGTNSFAQEAGGSPELKHLTEQFSMMRSFLIDQRHDFDVLSKKIDDVLWHEKLGDIAYVDKHRLVGPAHHNPKPTGNEFQDALLDNPMKFFAYSFIPRDAVQGKKYPLIVLVHGGVHGDFSTVMAHTVREFIAQGYIVVAPDYRGSTGYGKAFFQNIDYGGRENGDALACRDYMVESFSIVDPDRVGIVGWSHGGMIALMNITHYPDSYACAFAGVPVSDVAYRLEYKRPGYASAFTADYHIGKTPDEDPEEYARRSPVSYAQFLRKPLYITTTMNDDDVSVKEVQRMIDSLRHYDRDFEYEVYDAKPGAHVFDRLDTFEATRMRFKVHKFLERYLSPPRPFGDHSAMRRAAFYYY